LVLEKTVDSPSRVGRASCLISYDPVISNTVPWPYVPPNSVTPYSPPPRLRTNPIGLAPSLPVNVCSTPFVHAPPRRSGGLQNHYGAIVGRSAIQSRAIENSAVAQYHRPSLCEVIVHSQKAINQANGPRGPAVAGVNE
jgi:hypothetical protein